MTKVGWRGVVVGLALVVSATTIGGLALERLTDAGRCPAIADHPDWTAARRWDEGPPEPRSV